jgi:Class III cytochrome C family
MKKIIYLILFGFLASASFAQNKISKLHSKANLDCSICHACDTPTKTNPCLASCPRENNKTSTHKLSDAPSIFIINNLHGEKDIYGAVNFTHKSHAEMSEMSGGCETCHHYNPPGDIVKCSTCHEADRKKVDVNMPDLKSAYHRQCMDCHSEWEAESKCESCHTLNHDYKSSVAATEIVKVHKSVERPTAMVYETGECKRGKVATFHHNDHINLFGLQCIDCHQDESCQSCHNQKLEFKKVIDGSNHNRCATCHETEKKNNCVKCHSNKETKPFNHFVNTGFDINKYHSKISCSSCHKVSGKYSGLRANCQNCHDWDQDNFNHSITGLQLSDDHTDAECSDCHEDNNYSKPTCTNCHEEDEGFIVPQKLPGERVK